MGKTVKEYDEFLPFLSPMKKAKEYSPEHDSWKREIRKKYASWDEVRNHKRSWQE